MNHAIRHRSLMHLLIIAVGLVLIGNQSRGNTQQPPYPYNHSDHALDMLAYVSAENQLILYDPHDRIETILLDGVRDFRLSREGRVAFNHVDLDDTDLYVFNPATAAVEPINISQTPDADNYPLAWSPDGHYLAFSSSQEGEAYALYVWDGERVVNIMPYDPVSAPVSSYAEWSDDGRLAFVVIYGWSSLDIPPELYLWDGHSTVSVSQNWRGWDGNPSWSHSGQLLFASERDDEIGQYVWDGTSYKNGVPDLDTYIRLAPELEPDSPTWTDDGFIAFTPVATIAVAGMKQIVVWDLERSSTIRQILVASDYAFSWLTSDGQIVLSSHLASGIPSYYFNVEDTNANSLFSTVVGEASWSSGGYLAYCGIEDGLSQLLSIWDGAETWVVARVSYRPAQWQSVDGTFSCNNG